MAIAHNAAAAAAARAIGRQRAARQSASAPRPASTASSGNIGSTWRTPMLVRDGITIAMVTTIAITGASARKRDSAGPRPRRALTKPAAASAASGRGTLTGQRDREEGGEAVLRQLAEQIRRGPPGRLLSAEAERRQERAGGGEPVGEQPARGAAPALRGKAGGEGVLRPLGLPERRGRGDREAVRAPHDQRGGERRQRRLHEQRARHAGTGAEAAARGDRRDGDDRQHDRRELRGGGEPDRQAGEARPRRVGCSIHREEQQREQEVGGERDVGRREAAVSEDRRDARDRRRRDPGSGFAVGAAGEHPGQHDDQGQERQRPRARQHQVADVAGPV
jgi:hypothetical protein